MFEKEAEENGFGIGCTVNPTTAFQKGAEFGYNKAKEIIKRLINSLIVIDGEEIRELSVVKEAERLLNSENI